MFKTIEVRGTIRTINLDHISIVEAIITSTGGSLWKYRLVDGGEFQIEEDAYNELMACLPIVGDEEAIKAPSTAKPSDIGLLLTKLHNLLGGRGEAKLTTDRKARLTTRLKDFTPAELEMAARNLGADEFMQGANDNGKRYGTIDYLIRTSANINKYLEDAPKKKMF